MQMQYIVLPMCTALLGPACYLCSGDGVERFLAGGCKAAGGQAQRPQQDQRPLPGAAAHHRWLPYLLRHTAHGDSLARYHRLARRQHRLQGIQRRKNVLITWTKYLILSSFKLPRNLNILVKGKKSKKFCFSFIYTLDHRYSFCMQWMAQVLMMVRSGGYILSSFVLVVISVDRCGKVLGEKNLFSPEL